MKTIDELGISQTPWKARGQFVVSKNRRTVALSNYNDARLIAAAPDCYESLRNMTELFELNITEWNQSLHDALIDAKKALAKASGEEVK